MVLSRADAEDGGAAAVMRGARLIYLSGSSPMHLRSVLKNSKVWEALLLAWQEGAVVVGSSGAAMALTDPMVDARGGGLTIGLGLVERYGRGPPLRRHPRGRARRKAPPVGAAGAGREPRWPASPSGPPSSVSRTGGGGRPASARSSSILDGARADAGLGALPVSREPVSRLR